MRAALLPFLAAAWAAPAVEALVHSGGDGVYPFNATAMWVEEPFGNTSVPAGSRTDILVSWGDPLDGSELVDLYLLQSGEWYDLEESASEIIEDLVAADTPYSWRVPSYIPAGADYSVQAVLASDDRVWAESDQFTITEPEETLLWLLGIFVSIAGSIASNLGVNLQKYSLMEEGRTRAKAAKRSYVKQPLWVTGLALVVVGSLGDFVALAFAPQSLVAPVGGFTMAVNMVFAHYFLHEPVRRRDVTATLSLVAGIVVIAIYSDKTSRAYTLSQLLDRYVRTAMIVYFGVVFVVCASLRLAARHIERVEAASGIGSAQYKRLARYHPFTYAALSGVLGAQSVLLAKSTTELIKSTLEGQNQFVKAPTYLIVLGMFFFIFSQIHWLTTGLSRFDAVYCVPVFQCFFIVTSVVGGGVYFSELDGLSLLPGVMFVFGVALTLVGVYALSQREMRKLSPLARFRSAAYAVLFANYLWRAHAPGTAPPSPAHGPMSPPRLTASVSGNWAPITAEDLATGAVGYKGIQNALLEIASAVGANSVICGTGVCLPSSAEEEQQRYRAPGDVESPVGFTAASSVVSLEALEVELTVAPASV